MSNIKYKPQALVSGWIEYKLVTDKLDPPVFRCRIRPVTNLNMMDGVPLGDTQFRMGRATLEVSVDAVVDWDIAIEGIPLPLTAENKMSILLPIIAEQVEGEKPGILLGIAILRDGLNRETFLKNLPATLPGGSK